MGLFSNRYDKALESVNAARAFYYRFENIFRNNITIKVIKIESHTNDPLKPFIMHRGDPNLDNPNIIEFYQKYVGGTPLSDLTKIDDLFNYYPKNITKDDKYTNMTWANCLNNEISPPAPCFARWSIKDKTKLIIKAEAIDEIKCGIQELGVIMQQASISIKEAEQGILSNSSYPELWKQLIAIEYRCNGAIAWFNYLDKIKQ